jgi:hypothetical protein
MDGESEQRPSEAEIKQAIEGQSVDWYLQLLVSICNRSGLEIGITLTVGGSVVSGMLVGGKKYFETFAKQFSDAWPGTDKEVLRSALAQSASLYDHATDDRDKSASPPVQYIHLANARIFHGHQVLPNSGVLWRGKINAVSGFSLGSLSQQ